MTIDWIGYADYLVIAFRDQIVQAVREQGGKIAAKQIYVDLGPNIPKWSEYKGILLL